MEKKNFIIDLIKKKKELSGIDSVFIEEQLSDYISKNIALWHKIELHPKLEKSKELKFLVKEIRKKLREVYGVFNIDINKRNKLFEWLKLAVKNKKSKTEILELHKKILLTHKSTRERLDYYNEIYKNIFKITGKPSSILDIGSGLNPLSFIFMNLKNISYTAIEFTDEDCRFLNDYFNTMKKFHIEGMALKMDLTKFNKFPKAGICFMFKLLDSLETLKFGITKSLLNEINSDFIVASFPKKSLSGKPMSKFRISWFERLISIYKNYEAFEPDNEIFSFLDNYIA